MIEEPLHPLIADPWTYDLIALDWRLDPRDDRNDTLDLTLRRDGAQRRLRFIRPHNIKIDRRFHGSLSGFTIVDIRSRQWDDMKVEVKNNEQDPGITFVAADLIDLDQVDAK